MQCKTCGAPLPDTAAFCPNCGAAQQRSSPPQQQYQPPQQQYQPSQQAYQPSQQPYQPPQQAYQPPQQPYQPPQQAYYPQQQFPQPPAPQKKKSGAGVIVPVAVLAALLICAVAWGLHQTKKLKAGSPGAQSGAAVQETESAATAAEPAAADPAATEAAAEEEGQQDDWTVTWEENPVAPNAGEMLGKLEGYWTAEDGSAFIRFAAEQYGWAVYVGYYYSDLEVYAHMDGELHRNQAGYYNAHFSEPASGGLPAFDFDMWIDGFQVDAGVIRCVMVEAGKPDYDSMPALTFSGYTMEEAAPPLN